MHRINGLIKTAITIGIALAIGIIAILLTSSEPGNSIKQFFIGPFSNTYFFGNMIATSIPLMLTGLAASLAFSASTFNLGLEGQLYFGALVGTFLAVEMSGFPAILAIVISISASALAGGIIAGISGWLKAKWEVNELISSLLISYTLVYIVDYFLESPFNDPEAGMAASPYINSNFMLSKILSPSDLHAGIFIAIAVIIFFYFIYRKSTIGYEMVITGRNRKFSNYSGIPVKKVIILSMFLSGSLAGLAGIMDNLGIYGRMIRGYSTGYGWNGIAVALIARNHPLLVIPAALLFAFLESGANVASLMSDITPEVARIIQSVIFYLITAEGLVSFIGKKRREGIKT